MYINDPKFKNTKDYNNINKMLKDDFVVFVDKFVNDASVSVDYENVNGTLFYTFYGFKFSTERIKKHKTEYINIHKYLKQTYGEDLIKMWDGYVDDNSNPIYTTVNAVFKEDQKTDLLRSILKQFQYDIKSK